MTAAEHTQLPLALQTEEWRPVVGWEDLYQVSNLGRVRSLRRSSRILLTSPNTSGYPQVTLCRATFRRPRAVHLLVAEAFLGPCPLGMEVNHKDGVKTNLAIRNLEYVTRVGNMQHAAERGLLHPLQGVRHHRAKLTEADVYAIRRSQGRGSDLARHFGVSQTIVSGIRLRRIWRHLPEEA